MKAYICNEKIMSAHLVEVSKIKALLNPAEQVVPYVENASKTAPFNPYCPIYLDDK